MHQCSNGNAEMKLYFCMCGDESNLLQSFIGVWKIYPFFQSREVYIYTFSTILWFSVNMLHLHSLALPFPLTSVQAVTHTYTHAGLF